MKHLDAILKWTSEEEGIITISGKNNAVFTARVYVTGPEEAEFRIQDVVLLEELTVNDKKQQEIICKVTKCLNAVFELLWDAGFEEVALVEKSGSKLEEILNSTKVVQKAYSEYMMCRRLEQEKSTGSGEYVLHMNPDENGYVCENEERSFFCRLLPYDSKASEEVCFYLYEVEVEEQQRNKGIATACLTELFCKLAAETPVTIYLQVGSYNEPAVHLYEKLGFEVSEEWCYYAFAE